MRSIDLATLSGPGPVPAGTPPPVYTIAPTVLKEAHGQCVAQRKQAMANAEDVPDLDKRAEMLAEFASIDCTSVRAASSALR